MRHFALILLSFVSINVYSQYSLNKVDSIVISKKYKATDVKELSKEIAFDFKSDSNKIRAFYIYVVKNIKYDITLANRVWYPKSKEEMDSITLYEVNNCIKNKKGICWDYSALFQKLCFYQGIEVEQIGGTLRDSEIMPENRHVNHGWNSLIINGKRKFIDCTFDPPNEYVKFRYDKFYLVNPEEFIFRCLPEDPSKQYLKSTVTYDQFKSLTYVQNAFYEHKINNLFPNVLNMKINANAHYLISFQIANIDKLTSIKVYINDSLIQTIEEIKSDMTMNLNLKLVRGDKIKLMSIYTIKKDEYGEKGYIAPLLTYIAK
jgi:transglutaminase/protease-like cytokinesis protein 3